jgi:hypothetical protein
MVKIKSKGAWLRILEAFVAVILIFSVLLFVFYKQEPQKSDEEITKLQKNLLETISLDYSLRSQILSDNVSGVETKIKEVAPGWINYSVRICSPEDICAADISAEILSTRDIYSSETLIMSNLTYFKDKKLKIFFWKI